MPVGDCVSPASHPEFSTPLELLAFIARLRELSGGKPTGFKLAIGHPWEWFGVAKAMLESGILPDFIVVDGAEGGTGAAPLEFINHVGVPMHEGLMLVHNTLVGIGLRDRIRIAAAGRIASAFDIARTVAMGADWCNAGRGFMFALGCIQSRSCHTDHCPTGVATQDPARWRALDVEDKATRVFNFHQNTLRALRDMLGAAGLEHPSQLGPEHILRRVAPTEVRARWRRCTASSRPASCSTACLSSRVPTFWASARPDSFMPPERTLSPANSRRSKLTVRERAATRRSPWALPWHRQRYASVRARARARKTVPRTSAGSAQELLRARPLRPPCRRPPGSAAGPRSRSR